MKKTIIISIVGAALTASASADVTWKVQNVGSDLHVWTNGSVDVSGLRVDNRGTINIVVIDNNGSFGYIDGVAALSDLPDMASENNLVVNKYEDSEPAGVVGKYFATYSGSGDLLVYWDDTVGGDASAYTPNIDLTINNKAVSDIWGTNLDDYIKHEIADLGNGRGKVFVKQIAAVPEPSSTALLGLGALGLLIRRKR